MYSHAQLPSYCHIRVCTGTEKLHDCMIWFTNCCRKEQLHAVFPDMLGVQQGVMEQMHPIWKDFISYAQIARSPLAFGALGESSDLEQGEFCTTYFRSRKKFHVASHSTVCTLNTYPCNLLCIKISDNVFLHSKKENKVNIFVNTRTLLKKPQSSYEGLTAVNK